MLRSLLLVITISVLVMISGSAMATEKDMSFLIPNQIIKYTDASYAGTVWNGMPFGVGKMSFNNGDIVDGWWENGLANGMGTYSWKNGDQFMGKFKDGKFDGPGNE